MLTIEPEPRNILILGAGWTGKSTAAGFCASHISRSFVIIVSGSVDNAYMRYIQTTRTRFVKATSQGYHITPELLEETRKGATQSNRRYLYITVKDLSPEQVRDFLTHLIEAVKASCNLCLIIDEAHLFCDRFHAPDVLKGFARGARHYGVDLFLVTHRLHDIDISLRCVLTHLVLFRTVEPRDLEVLSLQLDLGRRGEMLADLPVHYFILVNRLKTAVSPPQKL